MNLLTEQHPVADIKSAIVACFGKNPVVMDGGVLIVSADRYNNLVDVLNSALSQKTDERIDAELSIPEIEELKKDAARYRWLRELPINGNTPGLYVSLSVPRPTPNEWCLDSARGLNLDEAIDSSIEKAHGIGE